MVVASLLVLQQRAGGKFGTCMGQEFKAFVRYKSWCRVWMEGVVEGELRGGENLVEYTFLKLPDLVEYNSSEQTLCSHSTPPINLDNILSNSSSFARTASLPAGSSIHRITALYYSNHK
ncbi:hypothetical protein FCM35_KLT01716 [Carex littledalei]|uniref:Uncharacterized protein n=1 Tax=Carex littledalei TaxID=544730 RepID=A0A833QTX1_9POAL|nr:hypothetical protein FCM35_KLT01716 [Carex littledalei]